MNKWLTVLAFALCQGCIISNLANRQAKAPASRLYDYWYSPTQRKSLDAVGLKIRHFVVIDGHSLEYTECDPAGKHLGRYGDFVLVATYAANCNVPLAYNDKDLK